MLFNETLIVIDRVDTETLQISLGMLLAGVLAPVLDSISPIPIESVFIGGKLVCKIPDRDVKIELLAYTAAEHKNI